jgi:hypothetical protein
MLFEDATCAGVDLAKQLGRMPRLLKSEFNAAYASKQSCDLEALTRTSRGPHR